MKTTAVKQSVIDLSRAKCQNGVELPYGAKEFEEWLLSTGKYVLPDGKKRIEVDNNTNFTTDYAEMPRDDPFIFGLIKSAKTKLNLGVEVGSYTVHVYPPHKADGSEMFVPSPSGASGRLIMSFGRDETIVLKTIQGGHSTNYSLKDGKGLYIPLLFGTAFEITWDNSSSMHVAAARGARAAAVKKYPYYRWIVIIDFHGDTGEAISMVKDKAKGLIGEERLAQINQYMEASAKPVPKEVETQDE